MENLGIFLDASFDTEAGEATTVNANPPATTEVDEKKDTDAGAGIEVVDNGDAGDDDDKRVSFMEKVEVAAIPVKDTAPVIVEPSSTIPDEEEDVNNNDTNNNNNNNNQQEDSTRRGPSDLAKSLLEKPEIYPGSMAYLYQEGIREKSNKERFFPKPQMVRARKRVDIETGASTRREVSAIPVWEFKEPMNPVDRKIKTGQALTNFDGGDDNNQRPPHYDEPQYRMSSKNIQKVAWGQRKESSWLLQYLQWTFRASFTEIILTDFIGFGLFSLFWTFMIYLGALESPRCFVVAGTSLAEIPDFRDNFYFMDAFQLSWTTFSTVGYGIVYPQVNKGEIEHPPDCFFFSFLVAVESFVGVLFAAFCGSILFGKIARIQSIATIDWSSPMVIRYGKGVVEPKPGEKDEEDDSDSSSDDEDDDANEGDDNGGDNGADEIQKAETSETTNDPLDVSNPSRGSNRSSIKTVKYPPPVLEFRVINLLSYQSGGEIMNANLTVIASTEASRSMESLQLTEDHKEMLSAAGLLHLSKELTKKTAQKTANVLKKTKDGLSTATKFTKDGISAATHRTGHAVKRTSAAVSKTSGSIVQRVNKAIVSPSNRLLGPINAPIAESTDVSEFSEASETTEVEPYNQADEIEKELKRQIAMVSMGAVRGSVMNMAVDEGSKLVPRRIFSTMDIETDTHPFFKRVWNIRHVLNEHSPLLSAKAKRIIQKNHGKWPESICNPSFIRKNLHFHQIIVSLSGTQNSSGSDVYGLHVYEYESLNVGYTFAKMLDVDDAGNLFLDVDLLNDVREQRGGGGEDIRGFMVDQFGQEIDEDEPEGEPAELAEEGSIPTNV